MRWRWRRPCPAPRGCRACRRVQHSVSCCAACGEFAFEGSDATHHGSPYPIAPSTMPPHAGLFRKMTWPAPLSTSSANGGSGTPPILESDDMCRRWSTGGRRFGTASLAAGRIMRARQRAADVARQSIGLSGLGAFSSYIALSGNLATIWAAELPTYLRAPPSRALTELPTYLFTPHVHTSNSHLKFTA